jgi:hypothetical protein
MHDGGPNSVFFYINTFSLRQPAELNMTREGEAFQSMLSRLFSESVASAGHTVFSIEDWANPGPLRRAWCLLEVLESRPQRGCRFSVILPEHQKADLLLALRSEHPKGYAPDTIVKVYSDISAENAEAGNEDDKAMIFDRVEQELGFKKLDELVKKNMRKWQQQQVEEEMARQGKDADDMLLYGAGKMMNLLQHLDKAMAFYKRSLYVKEMTRRGQHPDGRHPQRHGGRVRRTRGLCQGTGILPAQPRYQRQDTRRGQHPNCRSID